MKPITWNGKELILLDQSKLPNTVEYIHCTDWRTVVEAIKMLRVRGAPAIGVAAAYALVLVAREVDTKDGSYKDKLEAFIHNACILKESRPTAINLAWAIERILGKVENHVGIFSDVINSIEQEAIVIEEEDKALNEAIGENGLTLFEGKRGVRILTHCNAGALATAGIGTALGVIRKLHKNGQLERVYADETRPLLQGARLTSFELYEEGIPITLQTDSMAAYAMQQGFIDAVIVGADRITTNGDVANKIGTYGVAVLAKAHAIPFYVAAPYSTFDFTLQDGTQIPIEMRSDEEVTSLYGRNVAPLGVDVLNPAFDVTPHELVTAIITEQGVLQPDYRESISALQKGCM